MEGSYKITELSCAQLLKESDGMLSQLSDLFSNNYGQWSSKGARPGENVKMSPKLMKSMLLFDPNACGAFVATVNKTLLGHVFYYKFKTSSLNLVCWITQLVTLRDARHKGIASNLIKALLASEQFSACGLVTSHPYAIRALEKACGCRCDRTTIKKYYEELILKSALPYINLNMTLSCHGTIDTKYYVDHEEVLQIIEKEKELERWSFGELQEGHEFFAFCFFF